MKRKRDTRDYASYERSSSKERKISNEYDGRIRTDSAERIEASYPARDKPKTMGDPMKVIETYQINNNMLSFSSQERDMSSHLAESMSIHAENPINIARYSQEGLQYRRSSQNAYEESCFSDSQNSQLKRNWTNDEIKLLDYAVDKL